MDTFYQSKGRMNRQKVTFPLYTAYKKLKEMYRLNVKGSEKVDKAERIQM